MGTEERIFQLEQTIAEMEQYKIELERERKKLSTVVKMSGDMIFEYDIARDYMTYTSPGEGILFSEQITENYTQNLAKIVMDADAEAKQEFINALHSGKDNLNIELRRRGADGEYHWVLIIGQTICDENNKPEKVLGKIQLIDEQKQKEAELKRKSERDSLTGLYNHMTAKKLITERLQNLEEGQDAYLVICDIDNFKSLNDTNGHMFGDAVICSFADEMTFLFPDAIRGRIGGDEFIMFIENVEREHLKKQLRSLNLSMSDRYDDVKMGVRISCSLGVTAIMDKSIEFETLFQWADSALYQVKSKGKGSYCIVEAEKEKEVPYASYLASERNKDAYVRKETLIRNDEELVLFCVDLLENVPNMTSALKMICERTCSYFHLDDMVCVEYNGKEKQLLYQWSRAEKSDYARRMYEPGVYDWGRLVAKTDEDGVILYGKEDSKHVKLEEAKSVMLAFSKGMKDYQGSVVFADRHSDRKWDREKETLLRIANHIFSRRRMLRTDSIEQEKMDRKLNYDALTGLPVYNRFVQMAEEYRIRNPRKQLYCVYSDFSNFQYMNEIYGYEVGDRVLHAFAQALLEDCPNGILFCRVTSDHFLGFIGGEDFEQAAAGYWAFADKFSTDMHNRYDKCNLILSSGIYEVREEDTRIATIMDNANEARKKCKEQIGVTAVVRYSEEIKKQSTSIKAMATEAANAYKNNEFYAYLQPKVSLKTGKIVGAEALVRWIRPDGKMVMPGQFIDIIEKNGFITKIDFCMLEQVMEYLEEAIAAGEEVVPISVNFSRKHNEFEMFVPSIYKRLDKYKVPAELLEAELTESVFMSDYSQLSENIRNMRARGMKISIDDFGSGYSSLNLLPRVTVDIIKMDKQFLDNTLDANQEEQALIVIKYLIKMLKRMGFTVLAEGVETKEQVELLKKADCDIVQGYYYAKPMPIKEFRSFLKRFNEEADRKEGSCS